MAPAILWQEPADEACRRIALGYVTQAVAAYARLAIDPEALHDLRVALRRLRSALRAFRPLLRVGRVTRQRLRALVAATGAARDAEVQIAWLRHEARSLPGPLGEGAAALQVGLAARRRAGVEALVQSADELADVVARLRERLQHVTIDVTAPRATLAEALAPRVAAHAAALRQALAAVHTAADETAAHAARIAAKRLRYLVEPVRELPAAGAVVRALKSLQEVLGELHDAHVAQAEVAAAAGVASSAELRAGLDALAERAAARRDRHFSELDAEWLRTAAEPLWEACGALVRALGGAPG